MSERLGSRAVVLGAGMAGLVAARVLADQYAQVVVVERNTVGVTGPRAGVPQGHHAHALLARGQEVMERLLPGMQADLTADGVLSGDLSGGSALVLPRSRAATVALGPDQRLGHATAQPGRRPGFSPHSTQPTR